MTQKHNINNKKVVLAVAPNLLDDSKGGMWVLNLANKFNDEKTVFILIGINKKNHKVNSNIILIEKTYNQNTLAEYYSMADVFVICSKRENFPTTCLESLSCGTPVVGFDSGGTRETAPNGLGAFVKYGDIELLEDKVRYFLNNKNSDKIKRECIQYAKKIYSKETMVNNYFKLYKSEDLQ